MNLVTNMSLKIFLITGLTAIQGKTEVLISWQDYDHSHDSWEPITAIRETAEETLAEYAFHHDLQAHPGWEWTKSLKPLAYPAPLAPSLASTAHDTSTTKSRPVEGRTKRKQTRTDKRKDPIMQTRSRSKTRNARNAKTQHETSLLLNNLMATFGMIKDNNGGAYTLKNYRDPRR